MVENIVYSDNFELFLSDFDKEKQSMIKKLLNSFAKGELDFDPRDCEHFESRVKIAISPANVVVYYDREGNDMIMIGGSKIHERAA